MNLTIVDMVQDHIATIIEIEKIAHIAPWTQQKFIDCLQAKYFCKTLLRANEIIGYIIIAGHPPEADLLNIAIHPNKQQHGYGQFLLVHSLELLIQQGFHEIFLEVRHSNHKAIAFYQNNGFKQVGLRQNYYQTPSNREDALVMRLLF